MQQSKATAARAKILVDGLVPEFRPIIDIVEEGSQVLDLGCGNGDLLAALRLAKKIRAQGIELNEDCIRECVGKGLSVYHGDLDEGLADFNDQSVDYVIMTNTLQALHRPAVLINEMARVGKKCIISLPNFAYWRVRFQLLFTGKMPKTGRLPYEWYDSPNIHLTTIKDFRDFCHSHNIKILQEIDLKTNGDHEGCKSRNLFPNFLADYAIFVIEGKVGK